MPVIKHDVKSGTIMRLAIESEDSWMWNLIKIRDKLANEKKTCFLSCILTHLKWAGNFGTGSETPGFYCSWRSLDRSINHVLNWPDNKILKTYRGSTCEYHCTQVFVWDIDNFINFAPFLLFQLVNTKIYHWIWYHYSPETSILSRI